MAYKIQYGSRTNNTERRRGGRLFALTLAFFALFAVAAYQLVPEQLEALRKLLFADLQVDALLEDLQEGASISDAVSAFCQGLLHGE